MELILIVIATPNYLHLPVAEAALAAGIAVMSDKPATATYDEVLKLAAVIEKAGLPYGLTHTYAGYSLVREARSLCEMGAWDRFARLPWSICRAGSASRLRRRDRSRPRGGPIPR